MTFSSSGTASSTFILNQTTIRIRIYMLPLKQVFNLLHENVKPLKPAITPIVKSVGCALAEDIISPFDVPMFANSAMDGITLRISDLSGKGPWQLPVARTIAAGDSPDYHLSPGCAAKIMTGAPIPEGADSVIKVEELEFRDESVIITDKPDCQQHIRPRGDDIKKGVTIFSCGEVLRASDIGVLASLGRNMVKVHPKPSFSVIATGSEIVMPGEKLHPGQIYNSNVYSLQSLLNYDGYHSVKIQPPVKDELDDLKNAIDNALTSSDVVIISGGVSMGDFDLVPEAVKQLGGEIIFHKARVKPGKPIFLAGFEIANEEDSSDYQTKWLIGLPGNPVSVVVCYHLYVRRVAGILSGNPFKPLKISAELTDDVRTFGSRLNVIGVRIEQTDSGFLAHPSTRQQSGRLSSIKGINGFIYIEPEENFASVGSLVEVELL